MTTTLARRLGQSDAVMIGIGSMIGAGLFAAFAPAARAAGAGLLVGLLLAAVVAFCNATSSAQLAAQYPAAGGTYLYGRERLGPWRGFVAGWCFVIGKTASCAAMAMTVAAYAVPAGWQRPVAVLAVLALTAVNLRGITRTAQLTRVIVAVVLLLLAVFVIGLLTSAAADPQRLGSGTGGTAYGVLQSAGLLFFAFAGYARIATLGEEVRDPQRVIPRAILVALALVVAVYTVVGVLLLATLGPARLGSSYAPLAEAAATTGQPWLSPVVRVAAATAALGALLALIAGIGRTTLAMARAGDLPRRLGSIDELRLVPRTAELTVGVVVAVLVLLVDLRGVIGFSSFGVLIYYGVANWSAWTQDSAHRRFPKVLQVLGMAGCAALVVTLPRISLVIGAGVLVAGVLCRRVLQSRSPVTPVRGTAR